MAASWAPAEGISGDPTWLMFGDRSLMTDQALQMGKSEGHVYVMLPRLDTSWISFLQKVPIWPCCPVSVLDSNSSKQGFCKAKDDIPSMPHELTLSYFLGPSPATHLHAHPELGVYQVSQALLLLHLFLLVGKVPADPLSSLMFCSNCPSLAVLHIKNTSLLGLHLPIC